MLENITCRNEKNHGNLVESSSKLRLTANSDRVLQRMASSRK